MSYRIDIVDGHTSEREELAEFLAAFVVSGELEAPRQGDDSSACWLRRMHWWWDENPFCQTDSPKGFILRTAQGEIVGYNGMIPLEYSIDGEIVPSLLMTCFFVREKHRSAVLGMISKQRSLAAKYHLIDGSPSPEMRVLLGRLGYRKSGDRHQFVIPLGRMGGDVSHTLLEKLGMSIELDRRAIDTTSYLAFTPSEIEEIPEVEDGKLRRRITVESLEWLTSVGSEKRAFIGLCDKYGSLQAYVIGIYKRRYGVKAFVLMDYVDLTPGKVAMPDLLARMVSAPIDSGLDTDTDVLSWSIYDGSEFRTSRGIRRESILHYQLPKKWKDCAKACVPFETDLLLQ